MTDAATARLVRRGWRLAWPVGAISWAVWLASLALGGWEYDVEGTLLGIDHLAFYSAANLVRDGDAGRMYDYDFLGPYQGGLVGTPDWGALVGYRNPPFYALLYLPTAGLPFVASNLLWMAGGLAVMAGGVYLLRPARPRLIAALSLTFFPVFAAVSFGQNSLLSLGLFAAVYRLSADRRPFLAGLAAGLLWYKPQLMLGLFVWWGLAPRRHAREWLGLAVCGLLLAAVSWAVIPDGARAFVDTLAKNVGYGGEKGWNKQSPRAFWTLLLPDAPTPLTWSLTVASALAGVAVFVRLARRTGGPLAVLYPAAVFLTLWLSPHTLIYEWSILIPAAVVLWERFPARRDAWAGLFAFSWVVLLVSTPLAKFQIEYLEPQPVFQLAVPAMAWAGWRAARELSDRNDRTEPHDQRR